MVAIQNIFVNLKRFDVPKAMGGICPEDSPESWIKNIMGQSIELSLGQMNDMHITYLLPEALLIPALSCVSEAGPDEVRNLSIGCQNVFREDVAAGKNFGAFTSNRPASAMRALGCKWTMIGHSEERKDKLSFLSMYDPEILSDHGKRYMAECAVSSALRNEAACAFKHGMNVLFCIGETSEEKGDGERKEYEPRVKEVLRRQISGGLSGISGITGEAELVIGYEPVWAIGPGKQPPNADYISFVAENIKEICFLLFRRDIPIVYGGGLKGENAAEIGSVKTVAGGLVALTKFVPPIGFDPYELKNIVMKYMGSD